MRKARDEDVRGEGRGVGGIEKGGSEKRIA